MLIRQNTIDWVWLYVFRPVLQILMFILISAGIMSALALVAGIVLNMPWDGQTPWENVYPWHGILLLKTSRVDLFNQVLKQLPITLVDGITIGFVYATIALGYTMVYGVLKFVNFAHSEIFMVGGVIGYEMMLLVQALGSRFFISPMAGFNTIIPLNVISPLNAINPFLLIFLMILFGMIASGTLAGVVERFAYKPLRNAPRLVPLISAIGVSFVIQDAVRAIITVSKQGINLAYPTNTIGFFKQRVDIPNPLASIPFVTDRVQIAPSLSVGITTVIIVVSAVIMLVLLNYFVNGTKIGKAIRAVSQDQPTASLMGINVNLMISITFIIGGALGGAAGVLFGLKTTNITPYTGFIPGLKAFTAAVLGGIGNITGAVLGGILLGLLEAFFSSLLPYFPALGTEYSDIFAFSILILILIFRPAGLLGRRVDEKV